MNKNQFYEQMNLILEKEKLYFPKKKLLLHACCAPCSCYVLELLSDIFQISIYYSNSNIYPEKEYLKRKEELVSYLKEFYPQINLIAPIYENESYNKRIKNRMNEKEGQFTCHQCYQIRLEETFQYAQINEYDYVATVMTISRQKNAQIINQIGLALQEKYPQCYYLISDFKKKKGIDRSLQLTKIHHLYQQSYCGCIFSYQEAEKKKNLE